MTKIHPTAIIDDGAEIGENVTVGPYSIIGPRAKIASGVMIESHVVIRGLTMIGEDTQIYPFASIGHPPQDLKYQGEEVKLIIGKNNVIREHVTMHPGTGVGRGETVIGDNGLFMVGAHVAHDCIVGNNTVLANNATLGGHVTIGDYTMIGGLSGVHQHTRVGPYAFIGGASAVVNDLIPYGSAYGVNASLGGLNIVGMKRRGMDRDMIHDLRNAYRLLFALEGTFQERIEDVEEQFSENDAVMDIINFIKEDSARNICQPTFDPSR